MKVWLVALMFLVPLALSAGAVEYAADELYGVDGAMDETDEAEEAPGEPFDASTWLAIMVGWVGILVVEVRMNDNLNVLHEKIDKLERYVNTRDNLLALRIDEIDSATTDDAEEPRRERSSGDGQDDWKPQRRH